MMIKADIKKLFKTGFFHIFGGSVLNKIIVFLSSIVIVRILSKTEYGIFTYAWNIYSFVILVNGLGLANGALQVGSEKWDEAECENIFFYALYKGILFDCGIFIVMLLIAFFYPTAIEDARALLAAMCLLPLVQFLYELEMTYLRVKRMNQTYAKINIIATVLVFSFSIIGALLFREMGLVIGRYVAWILVIFIGFKVINHRGRKITPVIGLEQKRSIMRISIVSVANNGISSLLYLLDVFVLGIVTTNGEILASYKVATAIPTALLFIPSSIAIYVYPYFAVHYNDKKWCLRNYKKIFVANIALNFLISIILIVFAPLIIQIVFGKQYMDAVPVFRILSLSYLISSCFRIISSNLLVMMKKLKFNMIEALLSGVINVFADYYFIKAYGSIGAAIVTLIVVTFSGLMSTSYLLYTYKH